MVPAPWARHAAELYAARRRHRRAPHAERRARQLPLGADHPRPVAAVRRGRVPPHDRRPVGARRPRGGAPRVPGPDRAGAGVGHRRHPPRPAPDGDHAAARVLRRLPRAGRRVRPADPPAVDDHRRAGRLPVPQAGRRRRASCSPTTSTTTGAPAAATGCTRRSATCSRASPRSTSSRRSTRPRCAPCRRPPRAGSTTSPSSSTTRSSRPCWPRPARC